MSTSQLIEICLINPTVTLLPSYRWEQGTGNKHTQRQLQQWRMVWQTSMCSSSRGSSSTSSNATEQLLQRFVDSPRLMLLPRLPEASRHQQQATCATRNNGPAGCYHYHTAASATSTFECNAAAVSCIATRDTGLTASYTFEPLSNLVYTRDQQVTTGKGIVMGRLRSQQRQKEVELMAFCFNKLGK